MVRVVTFFTGNPFVGRGGGASPLGEDGADFLAGGEVGEDVADAAVVAGEDEVAADVGEGL
jgi:hypothetical protein